MYVPQIRITFEKKRCSKCSGVKRCLKLVNAKSATLKNREHDVSAKKVRDVSAKFSCRNVPYYLVFVFGCRNDAKHKTFLGYVPISSSAPRLLGAAYFPILLSEVEQEQRSSGNGDREAIVVGAGLCDGEGERAYTGYAPHIIRNVSAIVFSLRRFGMFFCRNVRRHVFAETSFAETSGIRKISPAD